MRFALVFAFLCAGCPAVPGPGSPTPGGDRDPGYSPGDEGDATAPFTEEERAQSRGKLGGIWVNCYKGFSPDADSSSSLTRLVGSCGKPTGMAPVTPVRIGETQSAQDAVERFTFLARQGRCYRVFAVGSTEITDLDVALLDPSGRVAASDVTRDRWPVVPARGPLCVPREGVYTLEVAVVAGSGGYVLQVVGDGG